jgi:hypothetical protein
LCRRNETYGIARRIFAELFVWPLLIYQDCPQPVPAREAALTAEHFDEAYDLASKLLLENESTNISTFDVSSRLAMRFITISALLLGGNTGQGKSSLKELVRYHKLAEPNLKRDWNCTGTRHFIEGRAMNGVSKEIILDLIRLLGQPPEIKIRRIEKLASTLR